MSSIRIFLGDLTYDTVTLSTDSNPLNVGYIAAYCKSKFGADVEISLFKYIRDLEDALYSSPPHILGLSNYSWCERIGLEMFKLAKEIDPEVVSVWGGPNLPADSPSHQIFDIDHRNNSLVMRFQYDILKWLSDLNDHPMANFECDAPITLSFDIEERNSRTINNELLAYGNTKIGRAQVIKRVGVTKLWRTPMYLQQ